MLENSFKNNYESVHLSNVAGLLPAALLKMNSFTNIFQLSNNYTYIYFAEQFPLATQKNISYRSIKNYKSSHRKVFFIFALALFWL